MSTIPVQRRSLEDVHADLEELRREVVRAQDLKLPHYLAHLRDRIDLVLDEASAVRRDECRT